MNEAKLLLNKNGIDLGPQIPQKSQEQNNLRNNPIDIKGLDCSNVAKSSFENRKFQQSKGGLAKRTHKINKNPHSASNELNDDVRFKTKMQMNLESNIFSSIELENTTSKTFESSELGYSENAVSNNPYPEPHCQIRKEIEKQYFQQKNEVKIPSYNNESLENKEDSVSEDQSQRQPSITEIVQEEQHKQYYINDLVGYISGDLTDLFMTQMYLSHFVQMYENLRKSQFLEQKPLTTQLPPLQCIISIIVEQRKSLIVDLDETLVHCNESPLLKSDFFIPIHINGKDYQAGISIRPYAMEFLHNMAEHFEIIIYTASNSDYANKIIDNLDPTGTLVKHRLFREHCFQMSPGCHLKDLRILNRDLKDIVLIDNSAYSFAYQINNGIPIIPYLDNKNDDELLHLQHYLKELLLIDDVREVNKRTFHLEVIQNSNSIQQAVQYLLTN